MNIRGTVLIVMLGAGCSMANPADAKRSGHSHFPAPLEDSDFYSDGAPSPAKVALGQMLFYDKELSGNRNISCATCHHALTGTGDGLSLPVGEGGAGLGVTRDTGQGAAAIHERVPRNAPPVFNLGAREFVRMFHDGRVEVDPTQAHGMRSPAGDNLPPGLDNVLAVQAMFPVTSGAEMAGQAGENRVADMAALGDLAGVWAALADRLRVIPQYAEMFREAYADITDSSDITYVHAANALAAFEAHVWRFDDSPFDRYLRGQRGEMSETAKRGMRLFYGTAGCSTCHSGALQTDHDFHAIAMPQIGPGKGDGAGGHEDFGRERVTGDSKHRYQFRTPTLRNVALTGPWGHDGAYNSLRAVVEHHLDPVQGLVSYDITQAQLPSRSDLDGLDGAAMSDPEVVDSIVDTNELSPRKRPLRESEVKTLMAFLHALTDVRALDLRAHVPTRVPSGLVVFD